MQKVAPKLYKEQGVEKGRYVVKSFRTEGNSPVRDGLLYDLVGASEKIDVWSLGVLAFTLLTGEALIPSTRDDDCASGAAMHMLHSWGEKPDVMLELFEKIDDDAARDLVQQMLQRESGKRPKVSYLLKNHPFFQTESLDNVRKMDGRLQEINELLKSQTKQMERMAANIAMIKKLSHESKFELARTRHILVNCMIEANTVTMPTRFRVYDKELPELSQEEKKKMLEFIAKEDGSGISFETKFAKLKLSEEGADVALVGILEKYQEQVEVGIKWATCIKDIGSNLVAGNIDDAFNAIKSSIKDLTVGQKKYLYLIDDLTGEPAITKEWPIEITQPSDVVPKLLPVMVNTMRAMSVLNGAAGLVKMCGFPAPTVPKALSKGLKESVELLKQESSVAEFGVVNKEVKDGTEESKTVRGKSLREFMDFLKKHDPGLKEGKSGDFAGLQRIGDPENGMALWTMLTDPKEIADALEERTRIRQEEERQQQSEYNHNQLTAKAASENPNSATDFRTFTTVVEVEEGGKKTNELEPSEEIQGFIQAADITAVKEASQTVEEAASVAANSCCSIM